MDKGEEGRREGSFSNTESNVWGEKGFVISDGNTAEEERCEAKGDFEELDKMYGELSDSADVSLAKSA